MCALLLCACAVLSLQRNMVREGTAFLLDALAGDKPEEGPLQTKLLEINLVTNPQVRGCSWLCGLIACRAHANMA